MTVKVDGAELTVQDVVRVARATNGGFATATLDPDARRRIAATRAYIDQNWMHDDAPLMYAFNTGVGLFKDQRVLISDMAAYQRKTVYAHATGVGEPFAEDVTRAMMLLRANAFASNYSGPRVELVERLIEFLNAGLHPVIPQKGSVGASGDLAPLAHMAGAVCGFDEAEMIYRGIRMPAREAIAQAGFEPDFDLGAKDASALINGSTTSLALGVLAVNDARRLLKHADIAMCLSLEAMRGELAAFDPRLQNARPHQGQLRVARNLLRILDGTKRCSQAAREVIFPDEQRQPGTPAAPRVQDVYSLRCTPQVHGPALEAVEYVERIIGTEINSATDNPLIFDDGNGGYEIDFRRSFPRAVCGAGNGCAFARHGGFERDLGAPSGAIGGPHYVLWPAAQSARGQARAQYGFRNRAVLDVGAGDGEPRIVHAGIGRLNPREIECRRSRVELHLVLPQGENDRGECRAGRRRRIVDGRASAQPRRTDRRRIFVGQGNTGGHGGHQGGHSAGSRRGSVVRDGDGAGA